MCWVLNDEGVGGLRLLNWMKNLKIPEQSLGREGEEGIVAERTACINTEVWRCEHCYHER